MQIKPIGFFNCTEKEKYEVPRQATDSSSHGFVELIPGQQFEQALLDLDGFKRIWLIFGFDRNENWRPMVRPQNVDRKVGVFATRAPYRPNAIGMSCVKLDRIEGLRLHIDGHDLLDQTPVFDIKPYHPDADSFDREASVSSQCWLQAVEKYEIEWSEKAKTKMDWLENLGLKNIVSFVHSQLGFRPVDSSRKRVRPVSEKNDNEFILAYRTWRIRFSIASDERQLQRRLLVIEDIFSGYEKTDLADDLVLDTFDDRYGDIDVHRRFNKSFPVNSGV